MESSTSFTCAGTLERLRSSSVTASAWWGEGTCAGRQGRTHTTQQGWHHMPADYLQLNHLGFVRATYGRFADADSTNHGSSLVGRFDPCGAYEYVVSLSYSCSLEQLSSVATTAAMQQWCAIKMWNRRCMKCIPHTSPVSSNHSSPSGRGCPSFLALGKVACNKHRIKQRAQKGEEAFTMYTVPLFMI